MTDKSKNDDQLDVKKPTDAQAEQSVDFASFDDLADDDQAPAAEKPFEAFSDDFEVEGPMSLADEEAALFGSFEDDASTVDDFENSFAGQDEALPELEPSADLTDDEEELGADLDFDDLPDLEASEPVDEIADQPVQKVSKEVQVVEKPVFDPKKQRAADPFPLPDELKAPSEALSALEEPEAAVAVSDESIEVVDDLDLELPSLEAELDVEADDDDGFLVAGDDDGFEGLELDVASEDELSVEAKSIDDDLPDLSGGSFEIVRAEGDLEEKFFKDTLRLNVDDLYSNVLRTLHEADDMSVDATARARIGQALKLKKMPQVICRDLVSQKVVSPVQLSRAIARAQKRKEITSFLNIPHEAMALRSSLDGRICSLLRETRVIPLWHKLVSDDDSKESSVLHLAHEAPTRNLVLEAAISEYLPEHKFVWHFALRDVCGAFWLSGEDEDVDSSMEADALLDRIIGNAIDARSSDIHIDPSIKGDFKAMVRYRVDGFVQSKEVITLDQLQRLRIRIENIARMPKVDLHHPNKGAFTRGGYDWRIQIQPHAGRQGPLPRIVIRRLNPDVMAMEELGYPEYFIQYVREASKSPNGVILWTGPTGSGKTESIHSAIVSANPMGRGLSVHTIEDPPEKRVAGYAVQMEIAERDPARSGLELLKSSLRADPDVIVFGEVRDSEMAHLVFEAANTGHLVFSTLHTNTSLDAVVRLDELGIFGYNISYVRGIAAQRLVRRLCSHCKQPVSKIDEYTEYVFNLFGVDMEDTSKMFTHDPNGCPSCNYTGYHGRIAIAEWLAPNTEVVNLSVERNYRDLEDVAKRAGWKPMGYMGVLHVKNGITDVAELAAKVQELAGDI